MLIKLTRLIFLTLAMIVFINYGFTADIRTYLPYDDIEALNWANFAIIEGQIEIGDFQKFKNIYNEIHKSGGVITGVVLSSEGGNTLEAIRIGSFIRKYYMTTVAPSMGVDGISCGFPTDKVCSCKSSCFLIWAAGVKRLGNILGLHRPYFEKKYFKDLTASEAKAEYDKGSNIVKTYLNDMGIPANVIDEMFQHSSKEIYYLDHKTIVSLENVPFFEEWIIANCESFSTQEEEDLKFLKAKSKLAYKTKTQLTNAEKHYLRHLKDKKFKHYECMFSRIREVQLKRGQND